MHRDLRMLRDHSDVYELFLVHPVCITIPGVIKKPVQFRTKSGKLNCLCNGAKIKLRILEITHISS